MLSPKGKDKLAPGEIRAALDKITESEVFGILRN
jgi:hypothetical protein